MAEERIGTMAWLYLAVSLVAPILTCFFVIDLLIGVEHLKKHYWISDGIVISIILNGLGAIPLLNQVVRKKVRGYVRWMAIVVTTLAFLGYGFFMIAMLGV